LFGVYYCFNRGILTIFSRNFNLILLAFEFVVFQILYISRHIALIYSANERLAQRMVVSDKFKVDFIEITSHELRTPLHGIINIAQSVVNRLEKRKDSELIKGHDDLELVVTLAHRMSGIINDMYHFVRTSGDSQTDLRPTNLQVEVNAVLEVFGYSTKTNNIRFINHISPNASIVFADDRKLWQVFSNLIGNAAKYTASGSITVESRLADGKVYVSVTDTGIGMPGEDVNFIFEKATRLVSGSEHAEGLGLGLYIARQLVEDMGGEIFVEWTKPNMGTRITFTLMECDKEFYTRMRSEKTAMRSNKITAQPELLNLNWPSDTHILMVDDNADNLKVISDMFQDTNIPIDTVQDGQSCLDLLKKNSYDIVILDVMMPGMSGFEVCRAIRTQFSIFELPILMLTARDGSDEILTGFWSGANDYVIKPVDSIELRARVFTLITLKQSVSGAIRSELNFLQAQIRPHFIYNAFNTISAVALTDGTAASELIDDLSIYLRHCFRNGVHDELVSIEDELELVDAYLRIEKARFGDRLEVTMNIQANLHFNLPPLTVQPIVENAVRHGSLDSYNTTKVHIMMFQQDDDAVIEVSDNGPGIDTDKIQAVLGGEAGDKNSGIGLINVNRRLKLRYNRTLKIENTLPHGTRVSITVPMKHRSDDSAS
jgi:sensor histidine kinase YesM